MKILVTGVDGQLGSSIKNISEEYKDYTFIFHSINDFNLLDTERLSNLINTNNIDVVINCAAYTAVDEAQSRRGNAFINNVQTIRNLVYIAKKKNFYLLHFSTDYVFDGIKYKPYNENDIPHPLNVYGITKLKSETILQKSGINCCVIRTSWLYSQYGNNFVKTILKLGKERPSINVVNDQIGCPTYAPDLAKTVLDILPELILKKGYNIYHYCNKGFTSWYEFAKDIIQLAGLECKVFPISTEQSGNIALRPAYSVLDTGKIVNDFNIEIPNWQDSLKKCIKIMKNNN